MLIFMDNETADIIRDTIVWKISQLIQTDEKSRHEIARLNDVLNQIENQR